MADEEHLKILEQGVEAWNRWREENPNIRPDLSGEYLVGANLYRANLIRADLSGANLSRANLTGANLNRANLNRANLRKADFIGTILFEADLNQANLLWAELSQANLGQANLSQADLSQANLFEANLNRANLLWADLSGANLSQANLTGANLREAVTYATVFADLDLSVVEGLETIYHSGPSTVGINTIYRSKGKIPEAFLRGCGLNDLQIEMVKLNNPDLTSEQVTRITYNIHELCVTGAFQYYSCFISYSSTDEDFAHRLHNDLQSKGVRCWFAPEDLKIGDKIRFRIDESIRIYDKLLLILSESSIASEWVEHEVEHALDLERERGQTVLFPVRLDDEVMGMKVGWAGSIRRTRHIGDFCRWKDHDSYQGAFDRLLRDLKAEG
jgi:uncharacterized protein YjbI with pentapeptide repeats